MVTLKSHVKSSCKKILIFTEIHRLILREGNDAATVSGNQNQGPVITFKATNMSTSGWRDSLTVKRSSLISSATVLRRLQALKKTFWLHSNSCADLTPHLLCKV